MAFLFVDFKSRSVLRTILLLCLLLPVAGTYPPPVAAKTLAADLVQDGQPIDLKTKKYAQLFNELKNTYHYSQHDLDTIFKDLTISKKVLELMDKQWEAKPYYQYAPLFVTPAVIANGKKKLAEHKELLDRIEARFGVDREFVVAIWGIETRYGTNQGSFNVLQTLNTLFDAYPRRSAFFRKQLIEFLLLCRQNNVNPGKVLGSYAGAFGQTQFIPSSFQAYAVSFDGDDRKDVWHSVPDVLASIANYLKHFDWTLDGPVYAELGNELKDQRLVAANLQGRKGRVSRNLVSKVQVPIPPSPDNKELTVVSLELPPESGHSFRYIAGYPNFVAITMWNHSNRYAMAVTELAEALRKADSK